MEGRQAPGADRPAVSEFVARVERDASGVLVPTDYVRSVRTARHKLVRRVGAAPTTALYDLDLDPGETTDRAGDPALAGVLRRLRSVSDGFDAVGRERRAAPVLASPSAEALRELEALGYVK